MTYENIPKELYRIIRIFQKNSLNYNLFKCEHIFEGKNSNLDIIFKTNKDYQKAAKLLKKEGYLLYMSEKVEKYKKMYVKVDNSTLFSIHLHREVAWHNIKVMSKENIFKNQKRIDKIINIPSKEDSLIIHCAHVIYENYDIDKNTKKILSKLIKNNLNWDYIKKSEIDIGYIINCIKNNKQPNTLSLIIKTIKKLLLTPKSWIPVKLKILRAIIRTISPIRKGCLIALIGVNGSGKTTLARKTLEKYKSTTKFFNGQYGYYFGWEPFSFYAKFISNLLKRRNKKIFNDINYKKKQTKNKFSIFKELIFVYNYLEFIQRYLFKIYPKLRKNKLVITDRYFYDMYPQYEYAKKSLLLKFLFFIYPKPDFLFILNAPVEIVQNRGKDTKVFSKIKKSSKRGLIDKIILKEQIRKYTELKKSVNGTIINTNQDIDTNTDQIIQTTWKKLVK